MIVVYRCHSCHTPIEEDSADLTKRLATVGKAVDKAGGTASRCRGATYMQQFMK